MVPFMGKQVIYTAQGYKATLDRQPACKALQGVLMGLLRECIGFIGFRLTVQFLYGFCGSWGFWGG